MKKENLSLRETTKSRRSNLRFFLSLRASAKKVRAPEKILQLAKDFWEEVEEPKRVRWTKQRGDEIAAVEKLSKVLAQIFRATAKGGQVVKSVRFSSKEHDQETLLRR